MCYSGILLRGGRIPDLDMTMSSDLRARQWPDGPVARGFRRVFVIGSGVTWYHLSHFSSRHPFDISQYES